MTTFSTEVRDIRKFGGIATVLFGLLFGLGFYNGAVFAMGFFGTLLTLGLGCLLLPGPFTPVYKGWLTVGHFIGKVITTVVLSLAYFLVITPFGWLRAVTAGRPIAMKPDPTKKTYWIDRQEPSQPKDRYRQRY